MIYEIIWAKIVNSANITPDVGDKILTEDKKGCLHVQYMPLPEKVFHSFTKYLLSFYHVKIFFLGSGGGVVKWSVKISAPVELTFCGRRQATNK